VECPQEYIASYRSQWNEWQSTLHILPNFYSVVYRCKFKVIPTVPGFAVKRSNVVCLFVWIDTLKCATADIPCLIDTKRIFFNGKNVRLVVMFVSTHRRCLTAITHSLQCDVDRLALPFRKKYQSNGRFSIVRVYSMYEPWHKRLSLPPFGPYLATSNISPNIKVNKWFNAQCSEKEHFSSSCRHIQ